MPRIPLIAKPQGSPGLQREGTANRFKAARKLEITLRIALAVLLTSWTATRLDARQFIDVGTTSLLSGINQPYVTLDVLDGSTILGPSSARNTFMLDTGATSILAVGGAAGDLHASSADFDQGEFLEQGIGGFIPYHVSAPLTVRVRGDKGAVSRSNVRLLTDPNGSFGPGVSFEGIVGMPAMVGRVTSLDLGGSSGTDLLGLDFLLSDLLGGAGGGLGGDLLGLDQLFGGLGGGGLGGLDLFDLGGGLDSGLLDGLLGLLGGGGGLGGLLDPTGLGGGLGGLDPFLGSLALDMSAFSSVQVSFSQDVPSSSGHRYGVPVRPLHFDIEGRGEPPTVAPLPVVRATHYEGDRVQSGDDYVIDTGAQMSIISTATAAELGFDLRNPDSSVPVSGVGGIVAAPAFTVDRLGMVTEEGIEILWNNVQVLALDIDPTVDGVIGSDLLNSSSGELLAGISLDDLLSPSTSAMNTVHFDFRQLDQPDGTGMLYFDLNSAVDRIQGSPTTLQAGDANQDVQFDQLDVVQVLQRGKYLTGQPATWGDGDWDGAPGGTPGSPPSGDGVFDQLDIVASLRHGRYNSGFYDGLQARGRTGDEQTSIGYNAVTGELWVDAPAGDALTSVNIDSAAGIFTGEPTENVHGSFDSDSDQNIFKATFGGSFGSVNFGRVAEPGLPEEFLLSDLTVVGSLAGGGDLGPVDLIYVPEPCTGLLLIMAVFLIGSACRPNPTSRR